MASAKQAATITLSLIGPIPLVVISMKLLVSGDDRSTFGDRRGYSQEDETDGERDHEAVRALQGDDRTGGSTHGDAHAQSDDDPQRRAEALLGQQHDDDAGDEVEDIGNGEIELADGENDREADREQYHGCSLVEDRPEIPPGTEGFRFGDPEGGDHRGESRQGRPLLDVGYQRLVLGALALREGAGPHREAGRRPLWLDVGWTCRRYLFTHLDRRSLTGLVP